MSKKKQQRISSLNDGTKTASTFIGCKANNNPASSEIDLFSKNKFVIKKIKKLAEQQKGVNEEWEKAKKLTQEDLDKKYEQKVAEAALFDKIMINSNATYAPYARPIIVPLLLSDVKRETSQEKTRIKKLISWLTFGNHWA